jgi:hypothetical protein
MTPGAPTEDEPLTDEELARVEAGEAELRRGESITLEDLKQQRDGDILAASVR